MAAPRAVRILFANQRRLAARPLWIDGLERNGFIGDYASGRYLDNVGMSYFRSEGRGLTKHSAGCFTSVQC